MRPLAPKPPAHIHAGVEQIIAGAQELHYLPPKEQWAYLEVKADEQIRVPLAVIIVGHQGQVLQVLPASWPLPNTRASDPDLALTYEEAAALWGPAGSPDGETPTRVYVPGTPARDLD